MAFRLVRVVTVLPKSHPLISPSRYAHASPAAKQNVQEISDKKKEPESFVMNMFRGNLQTSHVFPFPDPLTNEEKQTVAEMVDPLKKFFSEVNNADRNDRNAKLDDVTKDGLWELGAFGLQAPNEYGGLGLNNSQYAVTAEVMGQDDLAVGIILGAHQSIGFKGITIFGTPEQKAKYLPQVTTGKKYAAYCLTEPSAGSDAASIKTKAVLSPDGKYYVLNGSKLWISNGDIADIFTVFAKVPLKDPVTGEEKEKMTGFIVERAFGGVTSGTPEEKMGIKASSTAEVYFDNVKIPAENVLGGIGNGFKVAMTILNNGRFGMAAALAGTQKACIKKAVEFANERKTFGRTINTFENVQEKIGRMNVLHYVTESLAFIIAGIMDKGVREFQLESAIAKTFASDATWWVCDEAIQVLGGNGYIRGTGLERVMRDVRIFRIFEGANDILRLFIALTGIQHAGAHLKELQNAFKNPTANLGLIFAETQKRAFRKVGLGQTPSLMHLVHPNLTQAGHQCAKSFELFSVSVENLLMKYGKNIVDKQFLLSRLAYAAVDTYTMAVVLSRCTSSLQQNLPTAAHEQLMTQYWCFEASERVIANCRQLTHQESLESFKNLSNISINSFKNGGVVESNPLGIRT